MKVKLLSVIIRNRGTLSRMVPKIKSLSSVRGTTMEDEYDKMLEALNAEEYLQKEMAKEARK